MADWQCSNGDKGEGESSMTERKLGTVVISPAVLATIARLTTLSVPGVVQMSPFGVHRFLGARQGGGVKVQVIDEAVILDIYIVAAADVNMLQLSREIQSKVARAIREIVGMAVNEVNVHIVDVEAPSV
jgi:uncharacterized alkaline shock family protein YloU